MRYDINNPDRYKNDFYSSRRVTLRPQGHTSGIDRDRCTAGRLRYVRWRYS
jgi:hypothetical protein